PLPVAKDQPRAMTPPPAWNLDWDREHAYELSSIAHWGEGYFEIDATGQLCVRSRGAGSTRIPLPEIVSAAQAKGLRLPLLVRCSDVLAHRLARLQAAFARSMDDYGYTGGYTAIYPIKVNQQRGVAGELAKAGSH